MPYEFTADAPPGLIRESKRAYVVRDGATGFGELYCIKRQNEDGTYPVYTVGLKFDEKD